MTRIKRSLIIDAIILLGIHIGYRYIASVIDDPPVDVDWIKLEAYLAYIIIVVFFRFAVAWVLPLFRGKDPIRIDKFGGGGTSIPLKKVIPLIIAIIVYSFVISPFDDLSRQIKGKMETSENSIGTGNAGNTDGK